MKTPGDCLASDRAVHDGGIRTGSLADPTLRDQYSDHDLWLVVHAGTEAAFLQDLTWLPQPERHLAVIHFGTRGATVLYDDQHLVEVAVFTEDALTHQPTDRAVLLLDRAQLGARLPTLLAAARARRTEQVGWPDAIANLAVLVWTGCLRASRGEHLAAHKVLRQQALDTFLTAAQGAGLLEQPSANVLDPWRRLERVHPTLAADLAHALTLAPPAAALALLDLAVQYLRGPCPHQAWNAVAAVRRWVSALGPT